MGEETDGEMTRDRSGRRDKRAEEKTKRGVEKRQKGGKETDGGE